ncbi:hypothetical protein AMJ86_05975 [bacterium SM23_57]|nr:MAG: hypothetical protein AMJ86_05975 [bacterium SM23_57]
MVHSAPLLNFCILLNTENSKFFGEKQGKFHTIENFIVHSISCISCHFRKDRGHFAPLDDPPSPVEASPLASEIALREVTIRVDRSPLVDMAFHPLACGCRTSSIDPLPERGGVPPAPEPETQTGELPR